MPTRNTSEIVITADAERRRPSTAARRAGYGIAAAVNVTLLYLINAHPGWGAVPFLTGETDAVMPLVNASLGVGVVVPLVQFARDPRWLVALGSMATTAAGLPALVRLWQVFPLDFGDASFNWPLVARDLLAVGLFGSIIAVVVQAVALTRALRNRAGSG
ncbi:hypothetical protein [Actinoplanes sp. GCM10030250]|uniref:hypothetical protein n=1 Tax=Actinoplanes sp. GCM10030250 TaxID=3273376 RepID=UPI0036110032